jgi:hypothetical protein
LIPPDGIAKNITSHAYLKLLSVSFSFVLSSDISAIYAAVITTLVLESLIRPTGILARKCCSERCFCDFLLCSSAYARTELTIGHNRYFLIRLL